MALDLNLSAPEGITESVSKQFQELSAVQVNEARLHILDTLYDSDGSQINQAISAEYYHYPVILLQGDSTQTDLQIEAWIRSALYYSYNLVLLTQNPLSKSSQALLNDNPNALKHLAIRAYKNQESKLLAAAIPQYIPSQEPHIYLTQAPADRHLKQAMRSGFLAISLVPQTIIHDGQNGFILEVTTARALTHGLLQILDNSEYDWTYLQDCIINAQNRIS